MSVMNQARTMSMTRLTPPWPWFVCGVQGPLSMQHVLLMPIGVRTQ